MVEDRIIFWSDRRRVGVFAAIGRRLDDGGGRGCETWGRFRGYSLRV